MTALIGTPLRRLEGPLKVTGAARYAFEYRVDGAEDDAETDVLYAWPVQAGIASGRVVGIDTASALAVPGVAAVITHENALKLNEADDTELLVLQSADVSYRGQVVALVVASSQETAREVAGSLSVRYAEDEHDVVLTAEHPKLYAPEQVNPEFATDSETGDAEPALAASAVTLDRTYSTPALFNNPMEPHASVASWDEDTLTVWDSTQGTTSVASDLASLFGVEADQVRVRAPHVGGGFGSKGSARPNVVLAAMAARITGRPVKIALTRQMLFSFTGYRTPTIQRVRLGADREGHLAAVVHEAFEQTSTLFEFAEQTTEGTRHLYGAPNIKTTHRLAALDVPTPRWMRAPGECPGLFAIESAMDELAVLLEIDPVELRIRNDTQVDPESGKPFSSRHLIECLRRGAQLFDWSDRDPRPAVRRDGRWLVGTGMAAATYPVHVMPAGAKVRATPAGRFEVGVNATDIGTGARTAMLQIAADALDVSADLIDLTIADSSLPEAGPAGGSSGTNSWGWAVTKACRQLKAQLADGVGADGIEVTADISDEAGAETSTAQHAYGAHFVEARVDLESGMVEVPRMLGVFAAGTIVNPRTARSQFLGGMTMGLSMALHEEGQLDVGFGDYANHDFATYHIATCADVRRLDVEWIDEADSDVNPMGTKGIGEIGIVGSAAAVANAVWHATGVRIRDLPIQPDKLLPALPPL
jgi:xanthine dehydrogenase YagR molybdenum-binding subunit